MRVLTAGGGSGGHVTPVVAVVRELQREHPDAEIRFWCDKAFASQARQLMRECDASIKVETIASGKFRRYNALAWWKQLLMVRTVVWPNFRDLFKIGFGTLQSLVKLIAWRPDVVFTKGGFVCLPIGVAAHWLGIKLVIHDSDAHPGLTNRILARWAEVIATGAPTQYYPYNKSRMHYVGIPIKTRQPVDSRQQRSLKAELGFDAERPLVVVTGGGLGAQRINQAIADCLPDMLKLTSVALISGEAHYHELRQRLGEDRTDFQLHAFIAKNFTDYFAAADIVISRAGMTSLFELAALGKPAIVIPNIHLTGGHQQKNAQVYLDASAIVVVAEDDLKDSTVLLSAVADLLVSPMERQQLSESIAQFAKPQAARDVARLIAETATTVSERG